MARSAAVRERTAAASASYQARMDRGGRSRPSRSTAEMAAAVEDRSAPDSGAGESRDESLTGSAAPTQQAAQRLHEKSPGSLSAVPATGLASEPCETEPTWSCAAWSCARACGAPVSEPAASAGNADTTMRAWLGPQAAMVAAAYPCKGKTAMSSQTRKRRRCTNKMILPSTVARSPKRVHLLRRSGDVRGIHRQCVRPVAAGCCCPDCVMGTWATIGASYFLGVPLETRRRFAWPRG